MLWVKSSPIQAGCRGFVDLESFENMRQISTGNLGVKKGFFRRSPEYLLPHLYTDAVCLSQSLSVLVLFVPFTTFCVYAY
jgi:hypothetical protein